MPKNKLPPLPEQGPKLDLSLAKDVQCDNCQNYTFDETYLMKHVSALVSPTQKEGFIPIPVFACASCGHVNDAFLPPFMRSNQEEQPATATATTTKLDLMR